MSAAFREVLSWAGVDESAQGGPVMIVPQNGSNFVSLENGKDLHVAPDRKGIVIKEIGPTTRLEAAAWLLPLAFTPWLLGRRLFQIHAKNPVGYRGAQVTAVNRRSSAVEASLRVVVLKQKPVILSIRPVQIRDSTGKLILHTKLPFDAKSLLEQMNSIWTPQANIVLSLGLTTPAPALDEALIAKLLNLKMSPKAPLPKVVSIGTFEPILKTLRDPKADVTIFLVERAGNAVNVNGSTPEVAGVTDANLQMGLVGDNPDRFFCTRTMAHEIGHFLGRYRKEDGTVKGFDDLHEDANKLMRQGGSGLKVPSEHVIGYFNSGY